jgi:hypothetical protein
MSDNPTEDLKKRLIDELLDAPQGTRDSEMPPSPNPFGGEVGPDPGDTTLPVVDLSDSTGAGDSPETGEEDDPGIADAGGVNSGSADGSTRTGAA